MYARIPVHARFEKQFTSRIREFILVSIFTLPQAKLNTTDSTNNPLTYKSGDRIRPYCIAETTSHNCKMVPSGVVAISHDCKTES